MKNNILVFNLKIMDTTVMECERCNLETDCIEGLCQECNLEDDWFAEECEKEKEAERNLDIAQSLNL